MTPPSAGTPRATPGPAGGVVPPAPPGGRALVAMSGGVDSSVAAALMVDAGWDVTGVTLKLWGGPSDTGCCSVADVHDARRVADRLGIPHVVWTFAEAFTAGVVRPYTEAHREGRTPNPCIECNRVVKFDRLLARALRLDFDVLVTGHHARIDRTGGRAVLRRGADRAKDQSYVLWMLDPARLSRIVLPVGGLRKDDVRAIARDRGLPTADKADSQDTCFIPRTSGRAGFLAGRIPLTPAEVVDRSGRRLGRVPAVQLVTIGQRRGLGVAAGERRYVVDVDTRAGRVVVGTSRDLLVDETPLEGVSYTGVPVPGVVEAQTSAHGPTRPARIEGDRLRWLEPHPRVAPGQSVVCYDGDVVVAGGYAR